MTRSGSWDRATTQKYSQIRMEDSHAGQAIYTPAVLAIYDLFVLGISNHFVWLLDQRNGVYYADGRSNRINVGRHSLGTRDRAEAATALERLDLYQAVAHGLADRSTLEDDASPLTLEAGRKLYEETVAFLEKTKYADHELRYTLTEAAQLIGAEKRE